MTEKPTRQDIYDMLDRLAVIGAIIGFHQGAKQAWEAILPQIGFQHVQWLDQRRSNCAVTRTEVFLGGKNFLTGVSHYRTSVISHDPALVKDQLEKLGDWDLLGS